MRMISLSKCLVFVCIIETLFSYENTKKSELTIFRIYLYLDRTDKTI